MSPPKGKMVIAVVIVLIIIVIATTAWYYTYRYGTILVSGTADGGAVSLTCQPGQAVKVVWARYTPADGSAAVDVAVPLQKVLESLSGAAYAVHGSSFGQIGGSLSFRYRCVDATKSGFYPTAVSTCSRYPNDAQYAVDMTGRNAAGTVVRNPYSTHSRVSLERYAETPEVAEDPNLITGIGKTSLVRHLDDRYRHGDALNRLSMFEAAPGQPGYMEEIGDGASSMMAQISRRSPPARGATAPCTLAGTDIDSDFYTDGLYGSAILSEGFTSNRATAMNELTASRTGLGSIRRDPRFEPGSPTRTPDGDASWAHGGHAGGPTSGGFGAYRFLPGNTWDWNNVHGFGDANMLGRQHPVEVITTDTAAH